MFGFFSTLIFLLFLVAGSFVAYLSTDQIGIEKSLESNIDIKTTKMNHVMTKNPFVLPADTLAYNALSLIQEKKITSIIVTNERKVIGALNIHDLFRSGLM